MPITLGMNAARMITSPNTLPKELMIDAVTTPPSSVMKSHGRRYQQERHAETLPSSSSSEPASRKMSSSASSLMMSVASSCVMRPSRYPRASTTGITERSYLAISSATCSWFSSDVTVRRSVAMMSPSFTVRSFCRSRSQIVIEPSRRSSASTM